MLLTKLKLSVGAVLIGGGLVSLAAFFASPGHSAVAREPRSVQTNPGSLADQELKARLAESTALAAKLQKEVQELRAELRALRATVRTGAGTPVGKVDPTAPGRTSSAPVDHGEAIDVKPNPLARIVNSARRAGESSRSQGQSYMRYGGLIFAASPTGNRVIAYDPITRWTSSLELHATKENPLEVSFAGTPGRLEIVALRLEGEQITRIAAFDMKSQTWHSQDLSEPVKGRAIPRVDDAVSYDLGRHLYTFNPNSLSWDHLDVGAIGDTSEDASKVNAAK